MNCGFVVALLLVALAASGCNKQIKPGDPLRGLTRQEQDRFRRGRAFFQGTFTPETGLGPLFNSTSCGECHEEPAVGGFGDETEVHATAFRPDRTCDSLASEGGFVIQQAVTPALKAALGIDSEPFPKSAFNADAYVGEMGVTNPGQVNEGTVGGKPIPPGVDPARDPEINQTQLDLTNDFVRFLAPPGPAPLTTEAKRGRRLFSEIGCAGCHIPTLQTGNSPVSALKKKTFFAYTDLLLHDMGPDLADVCLGLATPADFRTEPLIGLRFLKEFLHDGRAKTLEQAVELHGGEGAGAHDRFKKLSASDRAALIAFLKSL